MTEVVRHAIIGCGRVAPNHATAVRLSGAAELAWACDRDPAVLSSFLAEHPAMGATHNPQEVFADPTVASVSIAVDHAQHYYLARAALMAGKHVLVEKPLALSTADAKALVSLAETRGLLLMTVGQHRYDPIVSEVQSLIEAGALGRLVSIWATLICGREPAYYRDSYWRGTWDGEGGSLLVNQAYHCLDLMSYLGGEARAQACHSAILKLGDVLETEDVITATVRFANGALGSLSCTSATPEFWRSRIEVVGTKGAVSFSIDHPAKLLAYSLPDDVDATPLAAAAAKAVEPAPGVAYYGASHNRQILDFLDSVRGRRVPQVGPEAGVRTLGLILDLYDLAAIAQPQRAAAV